MHFTPSNIIDRDLGTEAAAKAANGLLWIKLEFGSIRYITHITYYNFFFTDWFFPSDPCMGSLSRYYGCLADNSNIIIEIKSSGKLIQTCGTVELTNGPNQSDQIYSFKCIAYGDEVLVRKNGTSTIFLSEMVVDSIG